MNRSPEDLRRQINGLTEKLRKQKEVEHQLALTEYELICATATMHVAVDDGKGVKTYAVSPELPTKQCPFLQFTVDGNRVVSARVEFLEGSMTFFLSAGGQVSFALSDDVEEMEGHITYHIRGFGSKAEAEDWAAQRRQSNVSK